ncbi:MAG TPA: protease pro-enzyme activation domain-containing protein [Bryobacteraceae bacterium]|nr:protease pro-enzyme activation domain-containing protein [Bryobacteraceae bacterium]
MGIRASLRAAGAIYLSALLFLALPAASQRNRILRSVDDAERVQLTGHLHPAVSEANDLGPVDPARTLDRVTLVLKPSVAQQSDLEQFLARQQDPTSADYHHWLTPEQYAERFGLSGADIAKIGSWLRSQNLTVVSVARGRNAIAFSGTAEQVQNAFSTRLDRYNVNGETHFANATEPSVPSAFAGVIAAIHGLNDFRFRPIPKKRYTSGITGNHYIAPGDIATIYDLAPLYNAGITGAGQKIAIVGQTQINLSDIQQYRAFFNLPAADPQITLVPNTKDPGIQNDDLGEADLDIEISGAVAPNATILYVYSDDVTQSVQYAIDRNLAPVVSMSYGLCEQQTGTAELTALQTWARQANTQGITWVAASGDNGAADCYSPTSRGASGAGLAVDAPASIPEVTGVGGTTFAEGSGTWWNATGDANHASALSYIPEVAWNDSALDGSPSASGGGASTFFTAKPAWQIGPGVPNDSARDVPDISLASSADHDGFLIYSQSSLQAAGGTSVAAPTFAGMLALLNQYLVANGLQKDAGVGNVNPQLYALAQSAPAAFHDITSGDNMVTPCSSRVRGCANPAIGYNAGPGYDQATGLGSVDGFNLITSWSETGSVMRTSAAVALAASATAIQRTESIVLTATVKSPGGAIPTGKVTFSSAGLILGAVGLKASGDGATATLTVQGSQLAPGLSSITAQYQGDTGYRAAAATVSLTVTAPGAMAIQGVTSAASYRQAFAPGMIVSVFGTQLAATTAAASSIPLPTTLGGVAATINGVPAPLYYVSQGQINLQIPYSISPGTVATLSLTCNGQTATSTFAVSSAAPGIFTQSKSSMDLTQVPVGYATAARGQTIALYVTGQGAVSPAPAPGDLPATGTTPVPTQSVSVTAGGVPAATTYVGIPAWAIGLTQINITIPSTAPLGDQTVVVSVGGLPSAPANLTITQ